MLWDRLSKWTRQLVAAAMSTHAVPRHIGFIMDGNRRYAEKRHLTKIEGHQYGYQKLINALEWCLELGVECVSVYAFSIDNYKRSPQEVSLLMELAEKKLANMLQDQDVLVRHGVQVRVTGDLTLAPASVQQAAAKVMDATRHHTKAVLNICFSYTASQEMLHALDGAALLGTCGGSSLGLPSTDGGCSSSSFLDTHLYTQGCPPVDLLIRTSGETRLSDFLLWQSRHALLVFTHVLWPDFGFLDLLSALVHYQRCKPTLDQMRHAAATSLQVEDGGGRLEALGMAGGAARQKQEQEQEQHWQQGYAQHAAPAQQLLDLGMRPSPCQSDYAKHLPFPLQQQQQQVQAQVLQARPAAEGAAAAAAAAVGLQCAANGVCGSYGSDGAAVVKIWHLGGESPCGIASPESPSSPSVHSGEGLTSTPPRAKWEGLRTPSSSSIVSLAGASPRRGNGSAIFMSPSSHRLGSVDSFSSVDLGGGDGSGGLVQRKRMSYQDLLEAMGGA